MQKVVRVHHTVESYVRENFQQRLRAPPQCPRCHRSHRFQAHGYYGRYATDRTGKALRIEVRRFLCMHCARTLSCLPCFLQPYRLISNPTLEAFMRGEGQRPDVQRQAGLLQRYRKRFVSGWKTLASLLGNFFGRAPPQETATAFWRRTVAACGSLAELTLRLVQDFRTTCFGTYRCHQPT
jgi:hypothetical protein